MRKVTNTEKIKRGCQYCLDFQRKKFEGQKVRVCIHDECPYHELDEFDTYNQYYKSKGDLTFLKELKRK